MSDSKTFTPVLISTMLFLVPQLCFCSVLSNLWICIEHPHCPKQMNRLENCTNSSHSFMQVISTVPHFVTGKNFHNFQSCYHCVLLLFLFCFYFLGMETKYPDRFVCVCVCVCARARASVCVCVRERFPLSFQASAGVVL
jgi:hypothetical protein